MLDRLFQRPCALARQRAGPLLEERLRYLDHLAGQGMARATLRAAAVWLLCATAGGYSASLVNGQTYSWIVAPALSAILIAILWINAWEMRQRGLGHQIVMSFAAIAGVTAGFFLHLR